MGNILTVCMLSLWINRVHVFRIGYRDQCDNDDQVHDNDGSLHYTGSDILNYWVTTSKEIYDI